MIGEAPPADAHLVGSTWAQKKYDTEFGLSPSSASRSSGSKKAPKEAKESKAEVKAVIPPKPTVPKPAKKAAPPAAAAVVPPASQGAAEKKPVQVIADDLTLNPVLDCFINSEGVCFYADLDEKTLEPIPDMSRIIGSIPKGMDPEEATEKDFKKAEEE